MKDEKKVIETVEPEQEAAAQSLTCRFDFGDVEDQETAYYEYLEAVADEGGFWL